MAKIRVVILGGGTAGWMCAAALARLLDPSRYDMALVESDEIGTVGVGEATLPHIKAFNDMLGIVEAQFMRATQATIKLGIAFAGWSQAPDYIHPFGTFGEAIAGVDFHQHWLRVSAAGETVAPFQAYSYAIAAARAGRFEFPNEDPKSIRSTYAYAYHFDAALYAGFLRDYATQRGVWRIEGKVDEIVVNSETGHVETLLLTSGTRVHGDLFVDCSGFRSLLLGGIMEAEWESWSHWLPCDRAWAVPSQRAETLTPYTRATAQTAGWTWRIPLQHRTGNGYVFSSRHIGEDAARDTLLAGLDTAPLGEPKLLRFQAGRRKASWVKNVVAIGLSSGFLEPLESTSIYLIQMAVQALSGLVPVQSGGIDPRLAAEYNRQVDVEYERVRDFLILHYHVNERSGEALWDAARAMPIPDSLAHRLALFKRRGHIPFYQDGLFNKDSWLAVMLGQGLMPDASEPLAAAVPVPVAAAQMAELHDRIATQVATLATHDAFIAGYCAAPAREQVPA